MAGEISRRVFLVGIATASAGCATTGTRLSIPRDTTLIVLRHADRSGENLNDLGRRRAAALPSLLADYEVDAIYSTDPQRNLDTAAPLAAVTGLEPIVIAGTQAPRKLIEGNAGRTIVWVGNKNNLPLLWDAYGAPGSPPLEYGEVFVLRPNALGQPRVTRLSLEPVSG